jgi:hypothetical protein
LNFPLAARQKYTCKFGYRSGTARTGTRDISFVAYFCHASPHVPSPSSLLRGNFHSRSKSRRCIVVMGKRRNKGS